MCECYLGAHCVNSWSNYGQKRGISWQFVFVFSMFLLVLCVPVHENHKHVQGCNPTTTTSLPGRYNNNNKHGEKPNKKLGGKFLLVKFQS